MERITAVIFDMDGLMFDTEQLYERTWGQAVSEQGKVFTREIHSLIMGRSKADSAQILLDVYGPDFPVQKVIDRQTPLFFEALQTEQIPAKKGLFSPVGCAGTARLKKSRRLLVPAQEDRFLAETARLGAPFRLCGQRAPGPRQQTESRNFPADGRTVGGTARKCPGLGGLQRRNPRCAQRRVPFHPDSRPLQIGTGRFAALSAQGGQLG